MCVFVSTPSARTASRAYRRISMAVGSSTPSPCAHTMWTTAPNRLASLVTARTARTAVSDPSVPTMIVRYPMSERLEQHQVEDEQQAPGAQDRQGDGTRPGKQLGQAFIA